MNPIIYIAQNYISKELRKSMYVEKCLKDIIDRSDAHFISVCFNESEGCSGESNDNKITLGTKYLLGLWSLCFDYHTPACDINVYHFNKTFKRHTSLLYWDVFPLDCLNHMDFQQEIQSISKSIDDCDCYRAYHVFGNALWFCFLHELGHVYKGHRKTSPIEEEREADAFAVDIIKKESTDNPSEARIKKEGLLLNLIYILFHERVEDWNIDHPIPVQRIFDALEKLECVETDEIWEIAFCFIKHWHRYKQDSFDATIFPNTVDMNYKKNVFWVRNSINEKK